MKQLLIICTFLALGSLAQASDTFCMGFSTEDFNVASNSYSLRLGDVIRVKIQGEGASAAGEITLFREGGAAISKAIQTDVYAGTISKDSASESFIFNGTSALTKTAVSVKFESTNGRLTFQGNGLNQRHGNLVNRASRAGQMCAAEAFPEQLR